MRVPASWVGRGDSLDTELGEFVAQAIGVIGPVGQQLLWMGHHTDQGARTSQIVSVACSDDEGERPPDVVGQRVDFGGLPTTRTADGIVEGLLLRLPPSGEP